MSNIVIYDPEILQAGLLKSETITVPTFKSGSYLTNETTNLPTIKTGSYLTNETTAFPYMLIAYYPPILPILASPTIKPKNNFIDIRSCFIDMGVGTITRCGFFISRDEFFVSSGFEAGNLNGFTVSSTNTSVDTAKLVKIDSEVTSGNHSTYSAKITSLTDHTTRLSYKIKGSFDFSFKWRVSSERGCDILRWYVDGVEKGAISDDVYWHEQRTQLSEGEHEIIFAYTKDNSIDNGSDCGWIDDITAFKNPFTATAKNIPQTTNEIFSTVVSNLELGMYYIAAFAVNDAGVALSAITPYDYGGYIKPEEYAHIFVGGVKLDLEVKKIIMDGNIHKITKELIDGECYIAVGDVLLKLDGG